MEFNKESKDYHIDNLDFNFKNYLTAEEITSIATQMLERDNYMHREIVKGVLLVAFCTDIKIDETLDDMETYNIYTKNGVIEFLKSYVSNLYLVEEYVKNSENINAVISDFLKGINKTIAKFEKKLPKNFNLDDAITKLGSIANKDK